MNTATNPDKVRRIDLEDKFLYAVNQSRYDQRIKHISVITENLSYPIYAIDFITGAIGESFLNNMKRQGFEPSLLVMSKKSIHFKEID